MSIESVTPSNRLILCRPLLLPPAIFPSIRVFSNESALCMTWPKKWGFSFSIHPSNEYSGLISFRMEWLDLLAVQRTLKSLQHHSSKASILPCSAFFMSQLSHPYMITGKATVLTRRTFVGKVKFCLTLVMPRTVAHQAPLSMGFSRQKYQSGLPFPPPGDLLHLGIEPGSLALQADSLLSETTGKPPVQHRKLATPTKNGALLDFTKKDRGEGLQRYVTMDTEMGVMTSTERGTPQIACSHHQLRDVVW